MDIYEHVAEKIYKQVEDDRALVRLYKLQDVTKRLVDCLQRQPDGSYVLPALYEVELNDARALV